MAAFCFIDGVLELKKNESVTAFYALKGTEEFLEDHFKGFPIMPGVLVFEALKQAAVLLLADLEAKGRAFRLVEADDLKFGRFVKPENRLNIFARLLKKEGSRYFFDGRVDLAAETVRKALTAHFTLEGV